MNRLLAMETFVRVMDSTAFGLALECIGAADVARRAASQADTAAARGSWHVEEPA